MEIELRLFRRSDQQQLLRLLEAVRQEEERESPYAEDPISEAERADIGAYYAAVEGECWVGVFPTGELIAVGAFRKTSGDTAQIMRLAVLPEYRGQGFGRLMLRTLEQRAVELGVVLLHLDLDDSREQARELVEQAGFSMHERRLTEGRYWTMYAKWLASSATAAQLTPEEEKRFYADWDLAQQLTDFAKRQLGEGASPEQAMERLLASRWYKVWRKKKRYANRRYDRLDTYADLQQEVMEERRVGWVEGKAERHFAVLGSRQGEGGGNSDAVAEAAAELEQRELYEPRFEAMGLRLTLSQLGQEIAEFSAALGFAAPIRYKHFLAIFSGEPIADMEPSMLDHLVERQERAVALAEAIAEKYGGLDG
ncbi:MAG: Acetyltransferase family [Paenibacillus sp.]|jgi:GNAT superfamily N-acetyltransferase|nr:Acetyltransferase family [Paenibacillus sp.]